MREKENTADPSRTTGLNKGLKYEVSIATLVAATLSNNEQIKNYHIFTGLSEAWPFDDVVVKVVFEEEQAPYAFAIQLKSGKGEKLDVEKCKNVYNKIRNNEGLKTIGNIAIANIHFYYFYQKNVSTGDYKLCEYNPPNKSWRSVLSFPNCNRLSYNESINKTDKHFLDNFYLHLNQPDNDGIKEKVKTLCKIKNVSGIWDYADRYFENGELWKRGLSKEVFETELLKIRLSDHMLFPKDIIQLDDSQTEIMNKLIMQYNITIVTDEADNIKILYGCFLRALDRILTLKVASDICKINTLDDAIIHQFKQVTKMNKSGRVQHWINPPDTLESLMIELWKCRELPLILRADDELSALRDYARLKKSYIIVTDNIANQRQQFSGSSLKVFTHINDIECVEIRDNLLNVIPISLQGRTPITLYNIINRHEELTDTLSCSDIIHLMKPRTAYLDKECLKGDHNMIFLIADPDSTAKYNIASVNKAIGNIIIRCSSEEITNYRIQIEENANLKYCELYHCATSPENENLTLVEGNKALLKDFFVDQNGEDVYVQGDDNLVPIVGPRLKSIQENYIPRFLCSGVASESIFDSGIEGICFFSGNFAYLSENIRKCLVEASDDMEIENRNAFIKIKDEDVDKYWRKASDKCVLLHIHVDDTGMHLRRWRNRKGLSNHISYNGREIPEENILTEVTDGITILTGESGMGKSYLLQSIFKNDDTEKYILFYNLSDYGHFLAKQQLVPTNISLDFLLDRSKSKRYQELVSALFKIRNRILVLLDSFDEVLPFHKENVLDFIRNLAATKVQIIIASKIIANHVLMDNFNTRILKVDLLSANHCKEYIKNCKLSEKVRTTIPDEFLRNPLYLKLLKTISENNVNFETFSRLTLFENIINLKLDQYFERYFPSDHIPDKEHYLQPVRELHLKLALVRVLGVAVIEKLLGWKYESKLFYLLKLGIIVSIGEDCYPSFVHETFAEYLTADWIIRNKTTDSAKSIYVELLSQGKLYVLDILCEHLKLHKAVLERNGKQIKRYARVPSHLEETDRLDRMAIHVAGAYHDYIPGFCCCWTDCIICNMREFNVDFTQSDYPMHWDWVQHLNHGNDIDLMQCGRFSTPTKAAYVHCLVRKLRGGVDLSITVGDDDAIKTMYMEAMNKNNMGIAHDLFFMEDIMRSGLSQAVSNWKCKKINADTLNSRQIRRLTFLHLACINGNVKIVQKLIGWKHDVNATDSFGCTPLHYSVINPPKACMKMSAVLLRNGANLDIVNCDGKTAIDIAVLTGNLKIAESLLGRGVLINSIRENLQATLHHAIDGGVREMVNLLLKYQAGTDSVSKALIHASIKASPDIVGLLLDEGANVNVTDKDGKTPLMLAALRGNSNIVRLLLNNGANVNSATGSGETPLMLASLCCNSNVVRLLLEEGANVNSETTNGKTSLMFASEEGSLETVELLLRKDAKINIATKDGKTALMFASENYKFDNLVLPTNLNLSVAKELLKSGANVNSRTREGETPLIFASRVGDLDFVELFLNYRADVNSATNDGKTALMFASDSSTINPVRIRKRTGIDECGVITDGKTPYYFLLERNNLNVVKLLVRNGADVNRTTNSDETALTFASANNNTDVKNFLSKCMGGTSSCK